MIDRIPHELFTDKILGYLGPHARCKSLEVNRYLHRFSGTYVFTAKYFTALRIQRWYRRRTRENASREWRVSRQLTGQVLTVVSAHFPDGITGVFWTSAELRSKRGFTLITMGEEQASEHLLWKDVYEIGFNDSTPHLLQPTNYAFPLFMDDDDDDDENDIF